MRVLYRILALLPQDRSYSIRSTTNVEQIRFTEGQMDQPQRRMLLSVFQEQKVWSHCDVRSAMPLEKAEGQFCHFSQHCILYHFLICLLICTNTSCPLFLHMKLLDLELTLAARMLPRAQSDSYQTNRAHVMNLYSHLLFPGLQTER